MKRAGLGITGGLLLACSITAWGADERDPPSAEQRLGRLEQLWEGQGLAEIVARLQTMQQDLQRLQGELEVQAHTIEALQQSQTNANKDFDNRLRQLEQRLAGSMPPAAPSSIAPSPTTLGPINADPSAVEPPVPDVAANLDVPADTVTPDTSADPAVTNTPAPTPAAPAIPATEAVAAADADGEKAAYQQAFNLLKEGRYDKASAGFSEFLTRFPAGTNAANAQYWLGETYYVKRDFKEAQQAFQTLLDRYPASLKRPDATLKIGLVHYELAQWVEARKVLSDVQASFPGTTAAQLATSRLQKMQKEGH